MALIKPEIYSQIVTEKFKGKAILSNFAMDLRGTFRKSW